MADCFELVALGMIDPQKLFVGNGTALQELLMTRANRHGLVAGATGTGKTVTLQILSEGFSERGVPVFVADVKGDLSGLSQPGDHKDFLTNRAAKIGLEDYEYAPSPVIFWDVFGKQGHPVRTTISEMGPLLLSRLLDLNETQEGIIYIAFEVAEDEGLLLLDLDDLRSILMFLVDNAADIRKEDGNVSSASVGAIQRRLLALEAQGGDLFFGEPALELADFMRTTRDGRGYINVLAADDLIMSPKVYGTVLLWLLSELFEDLPEVGDPDKPKLVFFFDEAHLLFKDAPKALVERIGQVVRLIRSKGVGVFFVTQNPQDVPDEVLGQLGNRVQHALRAYTPRDQKAVRVAAQTFRQNPDLDTETVITQLGVGEALTSLLDEKGVPGVVQQTLIRPPCSRLGPATRRERRDVIGESPVSASYDKAIDRDSAHEILLRRADEIARKREEEEERAEREKEREKRRKEREKEEDRRDRERSRTRSTRSRRTSRSSGRQSIGEALTKSLVRSVSTQLGREIIRGLLGSFKRR